MSTESFDYVIAGGGLCGSVLASRLSQSGHNVVVLEAGSDENTSSPLVLNPFASIALHGTPSNYNYATVPQADLGGRQVSFFGGRLLGGGAAANYGTWTRGNRDNYDEWGALVKDPQWSYDGLLPYFKRCETYPNKDHAEQHGFDGPIRLSSGDRGLPFKAQMKEILTSTGLPAIDDLNGGKIRGVAPFMGVWYEGQRQYVLNKYDMSKAKIITNALIKRIIHDGQTAKGVELTDGRVFNAAKELIISCGAVRTPQLLMLSGIGPKSELDKHSIDQIVDLPVGQNLHDHIGVSFAAKLRNPEGGFAIGSPLYSKPEYFAGSPMDWVANLAVPEPLLQKAGEKDGRPFVESPNRTDVEILQAYGAIMDTGALPRWIPDGTAVSWTVIGMNPTSRGTVTLLSTNPEDLPAINPGYFKTEHDKVSLRAGLREMLNIISSEGAQKHLTGGELPPGDAKVLTVDSPDADFDERIRQGAHSFHHASGTAAMGSVVGSDCKVKGFSNLRVVDSSILPIPLSGHLQASMYAVAEKMAEVIAAA